MKINASQLQNIQGQLTAAQAGPADPSRAARDMLHQMAVDMVGKSGTIKSGYLKIVKGDGESLRLGTRWSTGADKSTRDALSLVQSLVKQGYAAKPGVQDALNNYLKASGEGHLGTHSFVKLVRDLEDTSGFERLQGDRLSAARVKADARLDTRGFAQSDALLADPQPEPLLPPALTSHQAEVLAQFEPAEPSVAEPPVEQQPAPRLAQNAQNAQNAQEASGLAAAAQEAPAQAAPMAPPVVPKDPRTEALAAMEYGQRAKAVSLLRQIEGAVSPQRLADFLVRDHLQGRAISTQMVLMAEAAYVQNGRAALDDVAQFAFAAATVGQEDKLKQPDFNAAQSLSGLLDVAMLWKARRPDEGAAMAKKLAGLVSEKVPHGDSAADLVNKLNAIGDSDPIDITSLARALVNRKEETLDELELGKLEDLEHADSARSNIRNYLEQVSARHTGDTALGKKIEALRVLLDKHEALAKPANLEEDGEIPGLYALTRTVEKALDSVVEIECSKNQPDPAELVKNRTQTGGPLTVLAKRSDGGSHSVNDFLHKVAVAAADAGQAVQGSAFERTAVDQAKASHFDQCYEQISSRNVRNNLEGLDLQHSIFSGVTTGHLSLHRSNLSSSSLSFKFDYRDGPDLRRVDFSNAILDDARIEIDYSAIEEVISVKRNRGDSPDEIKSFLTKLIDPAKHASNSSILTMIATIDDRYVDLKAGLMRQVMELVVREDCLQDLARPLFNVLSKSPRLMEDARIRELSEPMGQYLV